MPPVEIEPPLGVGPAAVAPPPAAERCPGLGPPLPPSFPCGGLTGGVLPEPPALQPTLAPPPEPPSAPVFTLVPPEPPPPPPADVILEKLNLIHLILYMKKMSHQHHHLQLLSDRL